MSEVKNQRVVLKDYVKGRPPKDDDFEIVETTCALEVEKGSHDVLIKTLYLSCDPYMMERMRGQRTFVEPFTPGEPIEGYVVGKVVKSDHREFKEGDFVWGMGGWEEYHVVKEGKGIKKIPPMEGIPLSYFIGVLGMPGCTAWYGFFHVTEPQPGEKVFVSAASGAVGQLVGQFAKLLGCYVVGSAGSADKVKLLKEKFLYDEAFNYKEEPDLEAALRRCFPKGLDIYYENVGGKMLDAVMATINDFGRIAVCGMITQYNREDAEPLQNPLPILKKRLTLRGFIILDKMSDNNLMSKFYDSVGTLLRQKKIVYVEDVKEGLENAPSALIGVLQGKNVGKQVVKVADP